MSQTLDRFVIQLSSGIAQRRLYAAGHPKIVECGLAITELMQTCLDECQQDSLFIGIVDGKLVYDGRFLVGPSIVGRQLVDLLEKLQSGGLSFATATTSSEVQALLGIATELKDPVQNPEEGRGLLLSKGIAGISSADHYTEPVGLSAEEDKTVWEGQRKGGSLQSPILVYQALYQVVNEAHGNAARKLTIDIDGARSVSENLLQSTEASFTDMMQLVHYPDFDSYTVGHSVRVATLAVHVGRYLQLETEALIELGTAGLLHDIGKSQIAEEILFKPGKLDDDEFREMQSHTWLGAEILLEHRTAGSRSISAAWGHHIRQDGGGYPKPPAWTVRSGMTALLQVCDVFEALTAVRPYKKPMNSLSAYEILLKDRASYDPEMLGAFIAALGMYPPGNSIQLSDGCRATVLAPGADLARPQVYLTHDVEGSVLEEQDQLVIDLDEDDVEVSIVGLAAEEEPVSTS